jgi:hypothetical protein
LYLFLVKHSLSLNSGHEKDYIPAGILPTPQVASDAKEAKKMTMRELGEKLGVIHSWIGKVEQGERRLDIIEYVRVCNALEIDPHEGLDLVIKALGA